MGACTKAALAPHAATAAHRRPLTKPRHRHTPILNNNTNVVIGPSFRLGSPTTPKGGQAASLVKHLAQCSRSAAAGTSASATSCDVTACGSWSWSARPSVSVTTSGHHGQAALGFCDDERPPWPACVQVDVGIGKSGPTGVQPACSRTRGEWGLTRRIKETASMSESESDTRRGGGQRSESTRGGLRTWRTPAQKDKFWWG